MSLSLREQLLKAGLVSEQQVKRAEREQNQKQFAAPRGRKKPAGPTPQQIAAQKAAAEKAARDAELNARKQAKLERRARYAEIKQLVAAHQIERVETEDFYNFQRGSEILRVPVTREQRARLVAGELAIVRCEGRFAFVPAAIGEQVGSRVEKALLHLNRPEAPPAADDPYKDYVVPDDLVW